MLCYDSLLAHSSHLIIITWSSSYTLTIAHEAVVKQPYSIFHQTLIVKKSYPLIVVHVLGKASGSATTSRLIQVVQHLDNAPSASTLSFPSMNDRKKAARSPSAYF